MNNQTQTEWRIQLAKDLFAKLIDTQELAAAFIGGSVARGLADEYSDIELCFVWKKAPKEIDRRIIIDIFGGEVFEWGGAWKTETRALEDDIYVNGFQLDIWHTTVANNEVYLSDVLLRHDTDSNKLNFLETLRNCIPLHDPSGVLAKWKKKAEDYPEAVQKKVIEENIKHFVNGSASIHAARGDLNVLYGLISGEQKRIFNVLFALNKMYFPTHKRMIENLEKVALKPEGIQQVFRESYSIPPDQAWRDTVKMMGETLKLVEGSGLGVDTKPAWQQLSIVRRRQDHYPGK